MCIFHQWSDWKEAEHNKQTWIHDKRVGCFCIRCGKTQEKILRIDCTNFRRFGIYCESCRKIVSENKRLASVHEMVYSEENIKAYSMAGRKPKIRMIRNVQKYRAKGMSFRAIAKKTRKHVAQIYYWSNYPLNEALKRYPRAKA